MQGCSSDWFDNVSAWHDGEVSEADAARVTAHLASCERCRDAASSLAAVGDALRASADRQVPPRVRERAMGLAPRKARRRGWAVAAAAIASAAAASAVLLLRPSPDRGLGIEPALADELVSRHTQGFAREHPCEIDSSDPAEVGRWLEGRLGYPVSVPRVEGASLLGARQCRLGEARTGAIMFRRGEVPLTVFVPPPSSPASREASQAAAGGVRCAPGALGTVVCAVSAAQPMLAVEDHGSAGLESSFDSTRNHL